MVTSSSWGFDLSMTNSLQSVSRFMNNFGNPQGAAIGFYGSASSVGGIIAIFVGGSLVHHLGRRACCLVGSVIVIGMAIMETFAVDFHMFTAAKLILGLGANVMQLGGPVLVMELAHPKSRVAISSLYNTNLYFGLVVGAWIAFGTFRMSSSWSWRLPCILQIALPTYQAFMIYLCPESPRWLVTKGRFEDARKILIKYHGDGVETELVKVEIQEIMASVEADATELNLNADGIKSILSSRGNLHRLWISFLTAVGSQCIGSTLISAYLPEILDQVGFNTDKDKTLINGLVQLCSWFAAIAGAVAMPYVMRRTMFLVDTSILLVIFIVWTALAAKYTETGEYALGIAVVVMVFLFNMVYCVCWVPLVIVYPLETVTNKQRSIFFAWMYFCINASSFIVCCLLRPFCFSQTQSLFFANCLCKCSIYG